MTSPHLSMLPSTSEAVRKESFSFRSDRRFSPIPACSSSEYSSGRICSYELDASGDPILATRKTFIDGLTGAEGANLDPLTNDFLFSTFGSGNQVIRVSGFASPVPEPSSFALYEAGLLSVSFWRRKR